MRQPRTISLLREGTMQAAENAVLIKPGCTKQLNLCYVGDVAQLSDFRQGSNIMRFFFFILQCTIHSNEYLQLYIQTNGTHQLEKTPRTL